MTKQKKDSVVQAGAPVLRAVAKPVPKKAFGSPALHRLLLKMSRVLAKEEYGVALAAPQVGEPLRLFVIAGKVFETESRDAGENGLEAYSAMGAEAARGPLRKHPQTKLPDKVFINPEIIRLSRKKKEMSEGCLSVRGKYGTVLRHEKTSLKAYDAQGKLFTYHGAGLIAHIFQHECDHLEGILYTDKALRMRSDEGASNDD